MNDSTQWYIHDNNKGKYYTYMATFKLNSTQTIVVLKEDKGKLLKYIQQRIKKS